MKASDNDAATRRQARADWKISVFRPGEEEAAAEADALFWDSIPIDQRAEVTWQLSEELYALAFPKSEDERRLPRSAFRVIRR